MAWSGYFDFGGVEIINSTRTEAYAQNMGLPGFRAVYENDALPLILGHETYASPLQDGAPWIDGADSSSYDFYGFYPLEVVGIENSSSSATVVESTLDGGAIGRPRRSTRSVVFSGVLLGQSECNVEYGMRWLRSVLAKGSCADRIDKRCNGATLTYLSCEPALAESSQLETPAAPFSLDGGSPTVVSGSADGGTPSTASWVEHYDGGVPTSFAPDDGGGESEADTAMDCYLEYVRMLHRVSATVGPQLLRKVETTTGTHAWQVQFTLTLGNPREFGYDRPFIEGFMDPNVGVPYVGGTPEGGQFDSVGLSGQTDVSCPTEVWQPVYDPLCPVIVPPPPVPNVLLGCGFEFPDTFERYMFTIPKDYVPTWGEVVPTIRMWTNEYEARSIRVRFYVDTYDSFDPNLDPCNYISEMLFSYIPPNSAIVVDPINRLIYIEREGTRQRADSLVFKADGTPFDWPELSCGVRYIVTVDRPESEDPAKIVAMDMTLTNRAD